MRIRFEKVPLGSKRGLAKRRDAVTKTHGESVSLMCQ